MVDRENIVLLFDGTINGLFTIIHMHYYEKINPVNIISKERYQPEIGKKYLQIETNEEFAEKVKNSIPKKISKVANENIFTAFLNSDENKFMDIYSYMVFGFKVGYEVDNFEQLDYVINVHKYVKAVRSEAHLLTGFTRFVETVDGIYYADISPKHNVIELLRGHFEDRFKSLQWIIHDTKREIALIFDGKKSEIYSVSKNAKFRYSENEENYQKLWKVFFGSIAIKERKNEKLQNSLAPKRFQKNMTEFKD